MLILPGPLPILPAMWHPSDQFADELGEPGIYTFTAALSFPLGIPDKLGHTIAIHDSFADPADEDLFGPLPTIDIRVFTFEEDGLPMWPPGTHAALAHFYGHDFIGNPEDRYGEGELATHHQWVTLETPSAPTKGELQWDDPAFAFHRCLMAFNIFLRAVQAATQDVRIRPVSSHDLRPVVVLGVRRRDGSWDFLNTMLMHPEAEPDELPSSHGPITEKQLQDGIYAVETNQPYLGSKLWRLRAQRALRQEGDASDAIISFQIAAESLLFDTYRMILVDEGRCSSDISVELGRERSFKSLLITTMPQKLGGRWDVKAKGTPVNKYWESLYRVRNLVVHAGYEPHTVEAEGAQEGYWALRDHLEKCLRRKRTDYPRTVFARLGEAGLKKCGVVPRRSRRFLEQIREEPEPWHWPHDLAGRGT